MPWARQVPGPVASVTESSETRSLMLLASLYLARDRLALNPGDTRSIDTVAPHHRTMGRDD